MSEIKLDLPPEANQELADPVLVQHYEDVKNRIVWIIGEIDETCQSWVATIVKYNREDQDIPIAERKPIKFFIDSPGGMLDEARMLIEVMKLSKTPIYTYALSLCASAASLIYLAGHKRFALPSVTFLFHKGSCQNLGGSYSEITQFVNNYKEEIDELVEFYKKYTNYEPHYIEEKLNGGDWYVRYSEAIEKGIITNIIDDIEDLI